MKIRLRLNKDNEDLCVLQSNHIPRYKEFIDLGSHRYIVNYVVYNCDDVYQDTVTDVIIFVKEIY